MTTPPLGLCLSHFCFDLRDDQVIIKKTHLCPIWSYPFKICSCRLLWWLPGQMGVYLGRVQIWLLLFCTYVDLITQALLYWWTDIMLFSFPFK